MDITRIAGPSELNFGGIQAAWIFSFQFFCQCSSSEEQVILRDWLDHHLPWLMSIGHTHVPIHFVGNGNSRNWWVSRPTTKVSHHWPRLLPMDITSVAGHSVFWKLMFVQIGTRDARIFNSIFVLLAVFWYAFFLALHFITIRYFVEN